MQACMKGPSTHSVPGSSLCMLQSAVLGTATLMQAGCPNCKANKQLHIPFDVQPKCQYFASAINWIHFTFHQKNSFRFWTCDHSFKGIIRPFPKVLELFSGIGRQSRQMAWSDVFRLKIAWLAKLQVPGSQSWSVCQPVLHRADCKYLHNRVVRFLVVFRGHALGVAH